MPDSALLAAFIPTFFFVAITPGMCMTLAMTLGMSIGVRRTLWMMLGELVGVAVVAVSAVIGVAALMLKYPGIFELMKWLGGAYLIYIGVNMWRTQGKIASLDNVPTQISRLSLISQGFFTAIANPKGCHTERLRLIAQGFLTATSNPKGWAFMCSLLPPFISESAPLPPQLIGLVAVILTLEGLCMLLYASLGSLMKGAARLGKAEIVLNRIAGSLMIIVGLWLALG